MGRLFECELFGRFYCCRACFTHLASLDDLVCKNFQSRWGKAYLFDNVVNVTVGVLEDKIMLTGLHTVADIYCNKCQRVVGWKYEKAYSKSQRYKEGKFVLERYKLMQGDGSDFLDHPEILQNGLNNAYHSDDNVEA